MTRTKLAALGAAAVLAIGSVAMPAAALAAGSTISATASATTVNVGSSFTVTISANPSGPITGAGASLTWDSSIVQLTAIQPATVPAPAGSVTFTTIPDVTSSNAAEKISKIAWFNLSYEYPGGADYGIFSATFQAIAPGSVNFGLPLGAGDGVLDDYGDPLTDVTVNTTSVTVPAPATPTPTPVPTATPVPTPTPLVVGQGTTNVSGTVDFGFLGLTVPSSVTIPLVRDNTNTSNVPVNIFSNIAWNLTVKDTKTGDNVGYMTDGTYVLANSMHVQQGTVDQCVPALPGTPYCFLVPAYDWNLSNGEGTVATGANNTNLITTLSQFVAPQDHPSDSAGYVIQILYSANSAF